MKGIAWAIFYSTMCVVTLWKPPPLADQHFWASVLAFGFVIFVFILVFEREQKP